MGLLLRPSIKVSSFASTAAARRLDGMGSQRSTDRPGSNCWMCVNVGSTDVNLICRHMGGVEPRSKRISANDTTSCLNAITQEPNQLRINALLMHSGDYFITLSLCRSRQACRECKTELMQLYNQTGCRPSERAYNRATNEEEPPLAAAPSLPSFLPFLQLVVLVAYSSINRPARQNWRFSYLISYLILFFELARCTIYSITSVSSHVCNAISPP